METLESQHVIKREHVQKHKLLPKLELLLKHNLQEMLKHSVWLMLKRMHKL